MNQDNNFKQGLNEFGLNMQEKAKILAAHLSNLEEAVRKGQAEELSWIWGNVMNHQFETKDDIMDYIEKRKATLTKGQSEQEDIDNA